MSPRLMPTILYQFSLIWFYISFYRIVGPKTNPKPKPGPNFCRTDSDCKQGERCTTIGDFVARRFCVPEPGKLSILRICPHVIQIHDQNVTKNTTNYENIEVINNNLWNIKMWKKNLYHLNFTNNVSFSSINFIIAIYFL